MEQYTNRLIHASSPYLLQHAHNPVDWYEWGDEAWQKARDENKPVLVSIGYSACHWCHVMERETFENTDTAALMNEFFVCIKVDREERPDVDQVYMDAVQLITGRGGWPLNMFCLPDGRPLHGGTYFPTREWNQLILQLQEFYNTRQPEAEEFAAKLTEGVRGMDVLNIEPERDGFAPADISALFTSWEPQFDWVEGGNSRVPKFPMPNNWQFLLNYYALSGNKKALDIVNMTLEKMGAGGIFDHLGGGFSRYSTDGVWLVPHFEKMLYDNGQLMSLYANAYRVTQNHVYKRIVAQTLAFVERELCSPDGGFYSALDADSEGEEGRFYVWTKDEVDALLGGDAEHFSAFNNISEEGNWEDGKNILHTKQTAETFASRHGIVLNDLRESLKRGCEKLFAAREERIRPGLDNKIICSWNVLMLKGYADAYRATGNEDYLSMALNSRRFIETHFLMGRHLVRIVKDGKSSISGFLEDYACVIDAFIQLYQCVFDERLLAITNMLAQTCFDEFYNAETGLFHFTSVQDTPLVARKTGTGDDVISSGNSIMCNNLFKLAYYFDNHNYKNTAIQMLAKMGQLIKKYPSWYSNWANAALFRAYGLYQIVITGEKAIELYKQFKYIPNAVFAIDTSGTSVMPLFANRHIPGETLIYICHDESCLLPVKTVEEAMRFVNRGN